MADGTLEEQTRDTAHDSVLAALGRRSPDQQKPPPRPGPLGRLKNPRLPPRSDATMPAMPASKGDRQ
jgi:hypothetical protein